MNKTLLVALREYVDNVRTKAFWLGILLFPVIIIAAGLAPVLLEKAKDARAYMVIDESGWLATAIHQQAEARDLGRLFRELSTRHQRGGRALDRWPQPLRELAPALAGLAPDDLDRAAAQLLAVDDSPSDALTLPDQVLAALVELRQPILDWWRTAPDKELSGLVDGLDRTRFNHQPLPPGPDPRAEATQLIAADNLFALIVIGPDPVSGSEGCQYVSNNLTDESLRRWFGGLASGIVQTRRMEREQVDPQVAKWLREPLQFTERKISTDGEEADVADQDTLRQWAPVAFVYLLWISVFSVAAMLLNNTVEEKSNRLIEVLLSSVSPFQLMSGKILGIAATGLTIISSWVLTFMGVILGLPLFFGQMPNLGLDRIAADPVFLVSFVVYFLGGYLLYAAILVGIGSVCNSLKEAQNMMSPVTMVLMVPLLVMVPVAKDPNGLLAQVLSYIPFFTPFVMMNRAAAPPTPLEYVLSSVILIVSVAAMFWVASRVFRIGILMTGKPPRLMEMIRWLRSSPVNTPARREE